MKPLNIEGPPPGSYRTVVAPSNSPDTVGTGPERLLKALHDIQGLAIDGWNPQVLRRFTEVLSQVQPRSDPEEERETLEANCRAAEKRFAALTELNTSAEDRDRAEEAWHAARDALDRFDLCLNRNRGADLAGSFPLQGTLVNRAKRSVDDWSDYFYCDDGVAEKAVAHRVAAFVELRAFATQVMEEFTVRIVDCAGVETRNARVKAAIQEGLREAYSTAGADWADLPAVQERLNSIAHGMPPSKEFDPRQVRNALRQDLELCWALALSDPPLDLECGSVRLDDKRFIAELKSEQILDQPRRGVQRRAVLAQPAIVSGNTELAPPKYILVDSTVRPPK